jgi:hypothetical protein
MQLDLLLIVAALSYFMTRGALRQRAPVRWATTLVVARPVAGEESAARHLT